MEKLISNLNKKKSLGPCRIPVKILQNYVDVLKEPLTDLINLQQGIFPEALKTVKPLKTVKKEDAQLTSNYRFFSVLPAFSKLH